MTLIDLLLKHEGLRAFPYRDTIGYLTIGVGRNLDTVGLSKDESLYLLKNDIEKARAALNGYPWFIKLGNVRQDALINLMFNLGPARFATFKKMIAAVEARQWDVAAKELLDSRYAVQVGKRALDLAFMLQTGEYPLEEA